MCPRRTGERGIALIAVLWVTLLLGLIAVAFLRETRVGTQLAYGALADARAESLADAGVYRAMLGILTADPVTAIRADGRVYVLPLEGGSVRVTVQDEGGKIDLNRASEEILLGVFAGVGADRGTAPKLAAALADYRDVDSDRRPEGAEAADYAHAGRPLGPKNGVLVAINELQAVLGVTPDLYARIEPLITVHSPRRDVDMSTAPLAVLRALPYATAQQIETVLAARQNDASRFAVVVATVISDATTEDGAHFVRRAVIRRGPDPFQPFEILEWSRMWSRRVGGSGS